MCGVKNYFPGQYFCFDGDLIRVNDVFIDDDNTIYYECDRFIYDSEEHNYNCYSITVDHDFVLKHYDLVFRSCEDCNND